MTIQFLAATLFFVAISFVASLPTDLIMRHKQLAMDHVRTACASDVEKYCSSRIPQPPPSVTERLVGPPEPGDALLMFHPMRLSSMLDDMMSTALSVASSSSQGENGPVTVTFYSSGPPPDIVMLDGMLSRLFSHVQSEPQPKMDVHDLTKKIVERGNEILAKETDENRVRLARRLTEVNPQDMTVKANMPFNCHFKNSCLHAAYEQGLVSSQCANAIQYLEEELPKIMVKSQMFADRYRKAMVPMLWIYAILCLATVLAIRRRVHKQWWNSDKRRLKFRIMQAIYSNPELKSKLEEAIGEPLGAVPPLHRRALEKMSGGGKKKLFTKCFALKVAFFATLVFLVFTTPFVVLPICIVAIFARLCYIACFMAPIDADGECVCCCCGGSTKDVQNGTVSAKQACCTCCQGTGVCAVACASCCGTGGDADCSCCAHGCHCCSDPKKETESELKVKLIGKGQKHTFVCKEAEVYHGIPLQIV